MVHSIFTMNGQRIQKQNISPQKGDMVGEPAKGNNSGSLDSHSNSFKPTNLDLFIGLRTTVVEIS